MLSQGSNVTGNHGTMLFAFISLLTLHFVLACKNKTRIRSVSWSLLRLRGACSNWFCIKKCLWWRQRLFGDQPKCCPTQKPCCAHVLFPGILGVLGARSSAGSWGSSHGPCVCCTIWQETLTFQCRLQGLVYFIQPWLSIKDINPPPRRMS